MNASAIKRIITILLLTTSRLVSQCDSVWNEMLWANSPTTASLLFGGYCYSGNIQDTTLCFYLLPEGNGGFIGYGFTSPEGYNVELIYTSQYDSECIFFDDGLVFQNQNASFDTVFVCFELRTAYIDNFCPYFTPYIGLAITIGEFSASISEGNLVVNLQTLSETNSDKVFLQWSSDAINFYDLDWKKASGNSSQERWYKFTNKPPMFGIVYLRIKELDLNGNFNYSETIPFFLEMPNWNIVPNRFGYYDIIGRRTK